MDGYLVQEGGGDVEAVLDVVQGALGVGEVLLGAQDGVVGAAHAHAKALVQGVHHGAAASDVLLQHTPQLLSALVVSVIA